MKRFLMHLIVLLYAVQFTAQTQDLNQYSFVVVPDKFDFLSSPDQYQLNSMAVFYLEKSGFNTFLASKTPNANRCDGLFADVEELRTILGNKLQVVLRDCNNIEIYRSEGKSKLKEFETSYQDALRKAFKSMELLNVKPKKLVLLPNAIVTNDMDKNGITEESTFNLPTPRGSVDKLPTAKYLNYSNNGNSFLLRKTSEGYSLYQETSEAEESLELIGKIVVLERVVKFMDTSGNVSDVIFDDLGNLTIKNPNFAINYKLVD